MDFALAFRSDEASVFVLDLQKPLLLKKICSGNRRRRATPISVQILIRGSWLFIGPKLAYKRFFSLRKLIVVYTFITRPLKVYMAQQLSEKQDKQS